MIKKTKCPICNQAIFKAYIHGELCLCEKGNPGYDGLISFRKHTCKISSDEFEK